MNYDTVRKSYRREGKLTERLCPICGMVADSPHHVKPRSLGGNDDAKNIVYLCRKCHDHIEELQEKRSVELSPELINEMRRELSIKLGTDPDGVSESYIYRDGKHFLLWVVLPNKTKKWIRQYIDGVPNAGAKNGIRVVSSIKTQVQRKPGRPIRDEIDISYLEELSYNKGMSFRTISRRLELEGFHLTFSAVRKRLIKADSYTPPLQAQCKQCHTLFEPKGNRRIYCSKECYTIYERHTKKL